MILYANGCSHTAAAEAVVPECFALDDGKHGIDRRPHPVNLAASWCTHVATALDAELICDAEAGGSNARILRTTRNWIAQNQHRLRDTVMVIQWTTWERQEWLHRSVWYQVNASGVDWVPTKLQNQYRQFIVDIDWPTVTAQAHQDIWQLHQELLAQGIRHIFFNGNNTFADIQNHFDWGKHYIGAYDQSQCYHDWLIKNGGQYAHSGSLHFDAKSHRLWAEHVLQYIYRNQILEPANEISAN